VSWPGTLGSVLAFQARLIELGEVALEWRLVGTVGGVVSGEGGVGLLMVTVILASVVLPALSRAVAVRLWLPLARVEVSQE
jgi:hypothetical protein